MTLADARVLLRDLADDGHACPVCTQNVKVYRRPMTAVAARALVLLWREHGFDFGHMPTLVARRMPDVSGQGGYVVLSQHWGLIESEQSVREDGGSAGMWRVTPRGLAWINGRFTVRRYARIYNGRCLGLVGPGVTVQEVLGEKFDLAALLGRTYASPVAA